MLEQDGKYKRDPGRFSLNTDSDPSFENSFNTIYVHLSQEAIGTEDLDKRLKSHGNQLSSLGQSPNIEDAISYLSHTLTLTPDGHPGLPYLLADLGYFSFLRFQSLGEISDLEKAIELHSCALASVPSGHPAFLYWVSNLGVFYTERFDLLNGLEDLEEAIKHRCHALTLTYDGHPHLFRRLADLGISYTDRFRLLDESEDLEKAIDHYSCAIALTPDNYPTLAYWHGDLGTSYEDRFHRLGQLEDLEKAIEHRSRALALTPDGHSDFPNRLADLGESYGYRFERLDEPGDLEKAMNYCSSALLLTPNGHPNTPDRLTSLGRCYEFRFRRLIELEDIEKAIDHYSRALALTSVGHQNLPNRLANLGSAYCNRYRRLGGLDDLTKAIEHHSRAVALTPHGHPSLSRRFGALGADFTDRFRRLGAIEDIEKAIEYRSCALELLPDCHQDFPHQLANLGLSYNERFQHLGDLEDVEKTIDYYSRALELTPNNHPDLSGHLAGLGLAYTDRFQHLGQIEDLEMATKHRSRALALTPDGHPDLSHRFASISVCYNIRFQHLNQAEDLQNAAKHGIRALELTPHGHPYLPYRFAHLADCFRDRFTLLGELPDLGRAIELQSRSLEWTPPSHPNLPDWLNALGSSYISSFKYQANIMDLEKAIYYCSCALAVSPVGHPVLPERYLNHAISRFYQYQHTHDISHLARSLDSFRRASQHLIGAPHLKFSCALRWSKLASEHAILNCMEAYHVTIELLPQFIWLGVTANQRYRNLSTAANLAVNAAFVAILAPDYPLALEWLEHARCVVWNQTLMLRSPIDQLHSLNPDLAGRLETIARQLRSASSEAPIFQENSSTLTSPEQAGRLRRRLAGEYQNLLTQARQIPGLEGFLQPRKANTLICAARDGPIILVNCHIKTCDALIILPGHNTIRHLPLPSFTEETARHARSELEKSLRHKRLRERGVRIFQEPGYGDRMKSVLATLWNNVVKPVLDFLGYTNNAQSDNLPHITWCPTGTLSFLPLHAAGDYDQPQSKIFDYVISSYTPTLTALLASTPSSLTPDCQVLAIGQANTPDHNPLPGTIKELACVQAHMQDKVGYSQLIDDQATTVAVLDAMEKHAWVHLACHAHQNVKDPTKSGFYLHDGTLDLAAMNHRSFKNKGLAFLSACQTATGHETLPDEAIHLASGMLMAGFPSVIGTMWSIFDDDAPFVADRVYAQLMRDGKVGNGEAGRALHYAVAALRDKVGEKDFTRWVPYIHIGS